MRLTPDEIAAIKTAAATAFGSTSVVRLFGSRVHDELRGGDIDLHFETDSPVTDRDVVRFEDDLFRTLDEQRIDKIFTVRGAALSPFEQICYRDGVPL